MKANEVTGRKRRRAPSVAASFLRAYVVGLAANGVPLHRIQYEFFGPADELLAA